MSQVLVSIIVPNYNHEKFLPQRWASITEQSFKDYEIILLDDASTDGSQALLKEYAKHSKVSHLVINKENSGSPFAQWKKGLLLAKGSYIWIAESDDVAHPEFLESMVSKLTQGVVMAFCGSDRINGEGQNLGRHTWAQELDMPRFSSSFSMNGSRFVSQYLAYRNAIPNASAVVFNKQAMEKIVLPIAMRYCGDWQFWAQLLENGSLAYVVESLNYFRVHKKTTRSVKSFELEKRRYAEYLIVIKSTSRPIKRMANLSKYDWILREWRKRSSQFEADAVAKLGLPWYFLVRYYYLRISKSI